VHIFLVVGSNVNYLVMAQYAVGGTILLMFNYFVMAKYVVGGTPSKSSQFKFIVPGSPEGS
jgi:hypothetical protein